MPKIKAHYIYMSFYSLISMDISEKAKFQVLIKQAKKSRMEEALQKLREFDAMREDFFKAAMPEDTPQVVIRKRTNKLLKKKREKELKRLLG